MQGIFCNIIGTTLYSMINKKIMYDFICASVLYTAPFAFIFGFIWQTYALLAITIIYFFC